MLNIKLILLVGVSVKRRLTLPGSCCSRKPSANLFLAVIFFVEDCRCKLNYEPYSYIWISVWPMLLNFFTWPMALLKQFGSWVCDVTSGVYCCTVWKKIFYTIIIRFIGIIHFWYYSCSHVPWSKSSGRFGSYCKATQPRELKTELVLFGCTKIFYIINGFPDIMRLWR